MAAALLIGTDLSLCVIAADVSKLIEPGSLPCSSVSVCMLRKQFEQDSKLLALNRVLTEGPEPWLFVTELRWETV